jgi:hypothetical protein
LNGVERIGNGPRIRLSPPPSAFETAVDTFLGAPVAHPASAALANPNDMKSRLCMAFPFLKHWLSHPLAQ